MQVLDAMAANGTPMRITDGLRTTGQQVALWQQGRYGDTRARVTQMDGVHRRSLHQDGRAVDCCFLGPEPYSESHPWGKYGDEVKRAGLVWGGDWRRPDRPHAELPATVTEPEVAV